MTESFPLKWPIGRERTKSYQRKNAAFTATPGAARDNLLKEPKLLGATSVIISSNVETYRRGGKDVMYATQNASKEDPGVAVYYLWKGDQYALACDRWKTVTDNLQALNKTVNAIRGIERWGTGEMMKAAFAGFKALPESVKREWWQVLDIPKTSSEETIKWAFRKEARINHPDSGGSTKKMQEINEAYQQALNSLK